MIYKNKQKQNITISNLTEPYHKLYFACLEDWSDEMKESGDHKECWYNKMKDKGLRVKLAFDESGVIGGMIQYIPIEYSFAEGNDLYFINCIWVHGHKKGRGSFQGHGMGKALLSVAEEDARSRGAKGIVAWGLALPFWMKASWFKRQGYKKVDKLSMQVLLWKPFSQDAQPPTLIKTKVKPELISGKVTVTAFKNGWCPVSNINYERGKRAAREFGDMVVFQEIDTFEKEIIRKWGICDALYVDDKEISMGPPLSYNKIKKHIARKVRKL